MKRREIEGRRECGGGIGMNRLEGGKRRWCEGMRKGWCEGDSALFLWYLMKWCHLRGAEVRECGVI
ncbi:MULTISPECIES: hypothetical protein [unclassified Bartonella]|uniref:hypothetical protein n=1 Tax=unclassified Bartonella TaxID=2645622 RepID=UPI0035CE8D8A